MIDESTNDRSSRPDEHPAGEMRISTPRRVGNRVAALGGIAMGMGMVAAMTVMDHTSVSVPPP